MRRHRDERGVTAVLVALLSLVLMACAAFSVDVGYWYVVSKQEQRAADAAALAGVTRLPADPAAAYAEAQRLTAANDFTHGRDDVAVTTGLDGKPTRLRVTVSKTVRNAFGGLLGRPTTTITRSAVADYAGPVPLGSPCNGYGNDPDATVERSSTCAETGQFWANVGSPKASKGSGDAYANATCSGQDGCNGAVNTDFDPAGYYYTVTVSKPVSNLVIDAFDPALVDVGDLCDEEKQNHSFIKLKQASQLQPSTKNNPKAVVPDPDTRYGYGPTNKYCTGDISYTGLDQGYEGQVATAFTVREPGANPNPWDPGSYPVLNGCSGAKTYPGFSGDLSKTLDRTRPEFKQDVPGFGQGYVASVFRRWVRLCTIPYTAAGTYIVQVRTSGTGADEADGHNRFALRAYSTTDTSVRDAVAVSGFGKMAMYANLPDATTSFYLARVPSGGGNHVLNVRLYDVGDSSEAGKIKVVAPPDSGVSFTGCVATGPVTGTLPACELTVQNSTHNGKWQQIAVPIPSGWTCNDLDPTKCWVRLRYTYGSGNQPSDTTSWVASLEGDPVRLVE